MKIEVTTSEYLDLQTAIITERENAKHEAERYESNPDWLKGKVPLKQWATDRREYADRFDKLLRKLIKQG